MAKNPLFKAPTTHNPAPTQAKDSPPSHPTRELAQECAKTAMISGWDNAIQEHAYKNGIPESRMREILDEAEAYNQKADPAGRIEELRDWKNQKRGRSDLSVGTTRAFRNI